MAVETHHLTFPPREEDIRKLKAGDIVYVTGEITSGAGLPTLERIRKLIDKGENLPIDLTHGSLIHVPSYSQQKPDGSYEILYVNPTTSTRFNAYMPGLIRDLKLRVTGGKGGLNAEATKAMKEVGCVYLSFPGGGATILSAAVKGVKSLYWDDLIFQYRLVTMIVENLGPLTVGIDCHGTSLYDDLTESAEKRLPDILEGLRADREAAGAPGSKH